MAAANPQRRVEASGEKVDEKFVVLHAPPVTLHTHQLGHKKANAQRHRALDVTSGGVRIHA